MASNVQQQQQQQPQQCVEKQQRLNLWQQQQRQPEQPLKNRQHQEETEFHEIELNVYLVKEWRFSFFNQKCLSTFATSFAKLLHFVKSFWILLLLLLYIGHVANGEGNVGCHFVRTLCMEGSEVCFNDNIFGKCIPTTGVDVEDIEKTPLTEEQSHFLATMLEELQGDGLGWDHPYVQCRIQGAVYTLQKQAQLPPNLCANLAPIPSDTDPTSAMAFVRFTLPEDDYVDKLYYPPLKKQNSANGINMILRQLQLQNRQSRYEPMELAHFSQLDDYFGSMTPVNPIKSVNMPNILNGFIENERALIQREQSQRQAELNADQRHAVGNQLELYQMLAASEPDPQPYQRSTHNMAEQLERFAKRQPLPSLVYDDFTDSSENFSSEQRRQIKRFNSYTPISNFGELSTVERTINGNANEESNFHRLFEVIDPLNTLSTNAHKRLPISSPKIEEQEHLTLEESLMRNSLTPFEEDAMIASNLYPHESKHLTQQEGVFTEGGLVLSTDNQIPEHKNFEKDKKQKARDILANMLGFTRHERLDVKKPGPLLGPPHQALSLYVSTEESRVNQTKEGKAETKEVLPLHIKNSEEVHKKKKVTVKDHSDEDHAPHSIDTEYAHVFVKNPIDSWSDGVRIVNELANILHMQGYFTYLTVQPHEVSFRVDSNNPERKTAGEIARSINENRGVKNNILRRLGVTVLRAGVGDKIKGNEDGVSSARIELAEQGPDVTHIMAYMFAGAGVAAVIVIFVTLILIKRHDKKRDKLGGLQSSIAGAETCSRDYQDLCRARMAGGKANAAEPAASGRITSLCKENDRPPSSRSSTSSWSEEPALTNMDISTGHMVLSYMEDHLRNKGRLQREWEALCRYEAEPSARDAAQQPQCVSFNRNGAPLPYDHSRVVLNHLANAEGLDYVNASTITDHDPRAPAYVAAQGPLPTTLAHFWQMIWEQGAVVIVALCRLLENGEVACARYWPEEGAEVYHIYEVHLVSEHIWCDDYLVRSFYLKNLRTSETRTVTQFHFLSWPQGGVPVQAKALLDFRRKVNKSYRGRSCPIVVHGSTGAGRTGAYILLDMVLGRMNKGAREIDIAATLEHLRDQRAGLVTSRQQFEFVLMAVAEEVHAILKALPANQSNEKREVEAKDVTTTTSGVLKEEEMPVDNSGLKADPATKEMINSTEPEKEAKSTPPKVAAITVKKK